MGWRLVRSWSWYGAGYPRMKRLYRVRDMASHVEQMDFLEDVLIELSMVTSDDVWDDAIRCAAIGGRRARDLPALLGPPKQVER